tara:strand:+ start:297 stop:623 length:327 start_codon:yes stop_codon:yes gene_type:complete
MNKKKLIIGGLFVVAVFVLYKKLYKKRDTSNDWKLEQDSVSDDVQKWEDLDKETVKKKAKEIRVGVNKTINANINKTKPTGDMLGLFPNGININWDRADFGNAFPNYG